MNILTIKKKIYLSARKRYNIVQKNDKNDGMMKRYVKLNRSFILSSFRLRNSFSIRF